MSGYPPQGVPQCTMEVPPFNLPELGHEGHPTFYKGYALPPKASTHASITDTDDYTETAADEKSERD